MKIYVGNLSFQTTEPELRTVFEAHGQVSDCTIVNDRDTGRPRGFGFVEMSDDNEGRAAITALDGQEVGGRSLKVNEARPKPERSGGGRDRW